MDEDEENKEEEKDERNVCPNCGLRQYGSVCASCNIEIENNEEPDLDKRKEDEYDEYDRRERR
jgi:DNA-directed RNA polymerase subunit RPC12/RpoP